MLVKTKARIKPTKQETMAELVNVTDLKIHTLSSSPVKVQAKESSKAQEDSKLDYFSELKEIDKSEGDVN